MCLQYEKLVSYWIGEKYTLRYTGGMVGHLLPISHALLPLLSSSEFHPSLADIFSI